MIARNLLGGTGQLPAAMGRELGDRARTGCRVHAIRPDGADLVVQAGGEEIPRGTSSSPRRRRTRRRSSLPWPSRPPPRWRS